MVSDSVDSPRYLTVNPDDKRDSVVNDNKHEESGSRPRRYSPEFRSGNHKVGNSSSSNNNNGGLKIKIENEDPVCKPRASRRSTRSRSVPKISKDRLVDSQRTNTAKHSTTTTSSARESTRPSEPLDMKREPTVRHNADQPASSTAAASAAAVPSHHHHKQSSYDKDKSHRSAAKEKKSKKYDWHLCVCIISVDASHLFRSKRRDHSNDDDNRRKRKHKKHKKVKKMKKVKKEKKDN